MNVNFINRIIHRIPPKHIALIFFVLSILLTQFIAYKIYTIEKQHEDLLVRKEALNVKNQLRSSLNNSVTATQMVAFLVEKDLIGDGFDTVSKELLLRNDFIDAIQLVEKSTIVKTYPLEGNEPTIGFEVMNDSMHRKEALKALARNELYFEGPFHLRQGGIGIVGRLPIYKEKAYWGFSAVIIRMNTLFKAMGIDSSGSNETYSYQLTKEMPKGITREAPFFNNPDNVNEGIYTSTFVPIGDWNLHVKLKHPVHKKIALAFSVSGILISLLISLFIWQLSIQPDKLKRLVRRKTQDLEDANHILQKHTDELMISNRELEQFAYVSSHDLQEPLRMVTSFLSRLEGKYGNQLDDQGRQYIGFAVDGAERMRVLISDLLEYSSYGRHNDFKEDIELNALIEEVKLLQNQRIVDTQAIITTDQLPTVKSAKAPLRQVFQNLISNALKYRKPNESPVIHIAVQERKTEWQFSVSDNGIGISKDYFDQIFIIFKRLHGQNEYSGTGIGLALVKKIIDDFGGRIWVESTVGEGSVFHFTVPKNS